MSIDPWRPIDYAKTLDNFLVSSKATMFRNFIFRDEELKNLTLKYTFMLPLTDEAFTKLSKSANHCYVSIKLVVKNHLSIGPVNFHSHPVYVSLNGNNHGNQWKDFYELGVYCMTPQYTDRAFIMVVKTAITTAKYPDYTNWLARMPHDVFLNMLAKNNASNRDLISLSHTSRDLYAKCNHSDPERNVFAIRLKLYYGISNDNTPYYTYVNMLRSKIFICGDTRFDTYNPDSTYETKIPIVPTSFNGWSKIWRGNGRLYLRPSLLGTSYELESAVICSYRGKPTKSVDPVTLVARYSNMGYQWTLNPFPTSYIEMYGDDTCSIGITDEHKVYVMGWNRFGKLGIGVLGGNGFPIDPLIPTLVLPALQIKFVSCGPYHTAFLDVDGRVWMAGNAKYGRLGLGRPDNSTRDIEVPAEIPNLSGVKFVSCGENHTGFLDVNGRPLTFGLNSSGELGIHDIGDISQSYVPMAIPGFANLKQISCGNLHTALLDENGQIWMCGNRNLCGVISFTNIRSPRRLQEFDGVKYVECSFNYTAFIDKYNNVWIYGDSETVRQSIRPLITLKTPQMIQGVKNVKQISCSQTNIAFLCLPNPF